MSPRFPRSPAPMPRVSLVKRIQTDPAYRAVIRVVGYLGIEYPISHEETDRLYGEFGKERVQAATDQLIDYDTDAKIARLKPGVRRLCNPLLGPSPEVWDKFYQGVENPPPNPYKKEAEAVAQAVADAVHEQIGRECTIEPDKDNPERQVITVQAPKRRNTADHTRWTDPKRYFSRFTDKELTEFIDSTTHEMSKCSPRSITFREALREIGMVISEFQHRDIRHSETHAAGKPPPRPKSPADGPAR